MVIDPPCGGVFGSSLSPRVNLTCSIGRPSVSAATCVIEVQVPGPMSLAALATSAVPSGSKRALAVDRIVRLSRHRADVCLTAACARCGRSAHTFRKIALSCTGHDRDAETAADHRDV